MKAFVQPTVKAMPIALLPWQTLRKINREALESGYTVRARFPRHTCGGALVLLPPMLTRPDEALVCAHCKAFVPATTQQLSQAIRAERAYQRAIYRGEKADRFPSPVRTYAPRNVQPDLFGPRVSPLRRCPVCGSRATKRHPEGGQGRRCPRCHAPLFARPLRRRRKP